MASRIPARVIAAATILLAASCSGTGSTTPSPTQATSATGAASSATPATPPASGTTKATAQASIGALKPVPLTVANGVDAGAAQGHSLNLPQGWTAQVWANVPRARMAAWAPDGRLLVATDGQRKVVALTPGQGDAAPTVTTVLDGLFSPQGLAFTEQDGRTILVVGEANRLVAHDYADGKVSNERVIIDGLPSDGHSAKMVAIKDGVIAYNVGSGTNRDPVDRTSNPQRATIAQINLDGTGNQTLAVGVRNGEGLSYAPDGTLFAAINQGDNQPYPFRDSTGQYGKVVQSYVNEHPNDQVSRITPGIDLGWPYCVPDTTGHEDLLDLGYVNDPVNNPDGTSLDCAKVTRTMLGLPAHSAPIGFVFTQGSKLPASLQNGALITAHGSWNRQPPREPYVAYSAWQSSTKSLAPIQQLVTGFQNPDGTRWGRCVDAVPGPDGALYVTDDTAGLVYRIVPA